MTILGRGRGRRSVYIPSNTGMTKRANAQLEAHAASQARRFNNSLQVDAPYIVCWNNLGGGIPCSCSHAKPPSPRSNVRPGQPHDDSFSALGDEPKGVKSRYRRTNQAPLGSLDPLDGFDPRRKISDWEDRPENSDVYAGSVATALQQFPIDTPTDSDIDDEDPLGLFSRKAISCSICMGTGYIDSWQPTNGLRVVLDSSAAYFFASDGKLDTSIGPYKINLFPDNTAIWLLRLPLYWDHVNRIDIYKDDEYIPRDRYTLRWVTTDNSMTGDFSPEGISVLHGVDKDIRIIILALEEMTFTHCEIILFYAQPLKGQIPEVQQNYEDEFVDWGQNITAEFPVGLNVKEGSYLSESKHNRVWKVNSVTHRRTAGDTEFGITAELRALHSFERRFYQLEVFKGQISDRITKQKNF